MQRWMVKLGSALLAIIGALAVWIISTQVFPYHSLNHDEGVYLQQAAMLLEGQLNLWPPVEEVFHPWFFVESGDRLYPKYTPVPAAMFALGQLLGGYRLALISIAGANLVLVVLVVDEVFDAYTGLLAGLFVLFSPIFLIDSSVFLPYAPTTLLNLVFAYGYLQANRNNNILYAAVAGVSIGLAFFSRPYTAVLFAIPFVIHSIWTLYTDFFFNLRRQSITALFGVFGVFIALLYNFLMTGSPWVFPYQAFAPLDGLGFGQRRIIGHEVFYTLELGLRANIKVVESFFIEWITGGIFGFVFVVIGLIYTFRYNPSASKGVVAGLFISIICGNIYFWGNLNILGEINNVNDGLISAFGPYYHFDLLLPTAAFAATGVVWIFKSVTKILHKKLDIKFFRAVLVLFLIINLSLVGIVTSNNLSDSIDKNMDVTNTYKDAYKPFYNGSPSNSLILLPDPYGDWLNHPFQLLRNNPGFDGRTIYAIDSRPFEVIDEFQNRRLYRYVYRGVWAPYSGSPEAASLQRVKDVSGYKVKLDIKLGIPDGAIGITTRMKTNKGNIYYTSNVSESINVSVTISEGQIKAGGDIEAVGNRTLSVEGRDTVSLILFVDYGLSGGFEYRFNVPVIVYNDRIRALSPRIEYCLNPRSCGGSAAYIPELASDGVFVNTELTAKPNP